MKYLLISLMIVILLRYVYELRYDYKDLIFILYYYAVMVLFGRNNLTMPIASMLLIHYYLKNNYSFISNKLFIAMILQYLICFSIDLLPIEMFISDIIMQNVVAFLVLIICLFLISKTSILYNNEIDDYKNILTAYMLISLVFIYYLIELLNFRYVNLIMIVIELYFFLSTIVFFVIIDLIARQSKEKRLVEIENIELKNIKEQYNITKYKSEYFLRLRHDFNYLKTMLNDNTNLVKQIDKINSTISHLDEKLYTDNVMVNSLINQIKHISQQYNLNINLNINAPISDMNLSFQQYDNILETYKVICLNNKEPIKLNIVKIDQSYIIEIISDNINYNIVENNQMIINKDNYLSVKFIIE